MKDALWILLIGGVLVSGVIGSITHMQEEQAAQQARERCKEAVKACVHNPAFDNDETCFSAGNPDAPLTCNPDAYKVGGFFESAKKIKAHRHAN